ncbi:hypothetical protein MKZ38_003802 [Zalerion maritima]|uniref:Pentatricopeptide repeat-containing protein n=1 Tax=Zalerion maritima TaxID=339359 RepID=A0AAD5RNE0_9PEZI|nr:hypothetical protein MKZ38_003802 [Zalerion maritima]
MVSLSRPQRLSLPPLSVTNHRPAAAHDGGKPPYRASFSKQSKNLRQAHLTWPSANSPQTATARPHAASTPKPRQRNKAENGSSSIALFLNIVRDQNDAQSTKNGQDEVKITNDSAPETKPLDLSLYGAVADLETKILTTEWASEEIVTTVLEDLMPRLRKSNVETVKMLRKVMSEPLKEIMRRKCSFVTSPPTATRIAMLHAELGSHMMAEHTLDLIICLIQEFISIEPNPELDTFAEHENNLALRDSLVNDILATWRVFCYPSARMENVLYNRDTSQGRFLGDKWPPEIYHFPHLQDWSTGANRLVNTSNTNVRLFKLFPERVVSPSVKAKLRPAIIGTYALLAGPDANQKVQLEARVFINTVGPVLGSGRLEMDYFQAVFQGYTSLLSYVLERWNSLTFPMVSNLHVAHKISMSPAVTTRSVATANIADLTSPGTFWSYCHRRVSKAIEFRDTDEAREVWDVFRSSKLSQQTRTKDDDLRNQYDYFVYAFTYLRSPEMAGNVFDYMTAHGIKPSVKTWTGMLHGLKRTGSAHAIERIWIGMLRSGIVPDMQAWTARISGLASRGAYREALRALDEMFSSWESPDRHPLATQPTIAQVNAILSALAGNNKIDEARRLIAWAKQKKLHPDSYTFNLLIDIAVRHGAPGDVAKALNEMVEAQVEPNEATVTLVFTDLLDPSRPDTPQEQTDKVMGLLNTMEKCGMKANNEIYGKVVYLLLKRGDDGEKVVKMVLSRLSASGLSRSPHIYAMLVDHYFTRMPPDIEAVDNLITTRRLGIDRPLRADRAFWERIIKGYADCGRFKDALGVWVDLVNAPGTSDLELPVTNSVAASLLKALVQHGDMKNAQSVVDTMEHWAFRHRAADTPDNRKFWRHNFWHCAHRHGLLKGRTRQRVNHDSPV